MTTTYDPKHPLYVDQADVRGELTRVFDICHDCGRCVEFCTSFPTLFEMIDQLEERDAGRLTPAQQDQVVDECFQCKLCAVNCPYVGELHEWDVDVPRLMLRASAMQHTAGLASARKRATTKVLGRADLVGRLATAAPSLANRLVDARPNSAVRKVVARVAGVSPARLLPRYATERFSAWFRKRPTVRVIAPQGRVAVFPTCLVEYQATDIGKDLVRVYERNGIECGITDAGCCGAPWLHAGDLASFARVATRNAATLADAVRSGTDVVVPQPRCGYVIRSDYVDHVDTAQRADAELVAAHTYDAAEYLMRLHRADDPTLATDFTGATVASITSVASGHLRAQDVGFESRDLMKLTGATVTLLSPCPGIDGMWGLRAGNEHISGPNAERLAAQVDGAGGEVVAGDCVVANLAIEQQTGREVRHPLQIMARAYGIADDA